MFLPVTADCFHYMTLVQLSVILPLNTYYVNLMVPPRRDSLINSPYFSLFLLSVFSFDFFASLSFVSQSFLLLVIVTFLPAPTALLAAKQHPKKNARRAKTHWEVCECAMCPCQEELLLITNVGQALTTTVLGTARS